ncbi:hypothetical protein GCM10022203_15550 [Micrococcus yunnanensis]
MREERGVAACDQAGTPRSHWEQAESDLWTTARPHAPVQETVQHRPHPPPLTSPAIWLLPAGFRGHIAGLVTQQGVCA